MDIQKEAPKTTEAEPKKCMSCKNFWGSENYQWLCSKCYNLKHKANTNEAVKKTQQPAPKKLQQSNPQVQTKGVQQNKSKCFSCNKKVGLLGVDCKCGYTYCNSHRLPEDHECSINYEQTGKEQLRKQIVKIAPGKLNQL